MPIEITKDAKDFLQEMVAERVQQIIDEKLAFWTKIAIGTVTVSMISLIGLFFVVLQEARRSSIAYAKQAASDEAGIVIKAFDVPGKILEGAVRMAQNAAKASGEAEHAAVSATSTIGKVRLLSETLTSDQESLVRLLNEQRGEFTKLKELLDDTKKLDTVSLAQKATELEGILSQNGNADKLAELLRNVNEILANRELHVQSLRVGGGTGVLITEGGIFVGNGGLTKDGYVVGTHRLPSK